MKQESHIHLQSSHVLYKKKTRAVIRDKLEARVSMYIWSCIHHPVFTLLSRALLLYCTPDIFLHRSQVKGGGILKIAMMAAPSHRAHIENTHNIDDVQIAHDKPLRTMLREHEKSATQSSDNKRLRGTTLQAHPSQG